MSITCQLERRQVKTERCQGWKQEWRLPLNPDLSPDLLPSKSLTGSHSAPHFKIIDSKWATLFGLQIHFPSHRELYIGFSLPVPLVKCWASHMSIIAKCTQAHPHHYALITSAKIVTQGKELRKIQLSHTGSTFGGGGWITCRIKPLEFFAS